MLTKGDLQNIEALFDKKFDEKFDAKFDKKFDEKFAPIRTDIKKIKSDVAKTKRDVNIIIETFDDDYIRLRQRVEVIEDKVGIRN